MRIQVDIDKEPPTAADIDSARSALRRQIRLLATVSPASVACLALCDDAYTAQACVALLFSCVMYLLCLTNEGEWQIFSEITPQQASLIGDWEVANVHVAMYCASRCAHQRNGNTPQSGVIYFPGDEARGCYLESR